MKIPVGARAQLAHSVLFALAAVATLGALVGLSGCGKKGPPLAPLRQNPAAATDFSVRQQGDELVLTLAYPTTTVAGLALPGLEAMEVWRLARPLVAGMPPTPPDPREFAGGAEKVLTLRGAELSAATAGDRLQTRLRIEPTAAGGPATAFTYAVRTVAAGGDRSEASNLATITPAAPPAPPADPRVAPRADGILITWVSPAPPAAAPAAGAVAGFRVYRREAGIRGYGEPLVTTDPTAASYLDTTARYGQRYVYTVATLASLEPPVESALEKEIEVDFQDRFGPPAPTGLVTLPEGSNVRLRWSSSAGTDVAGYLIFRQDPGGDFHQVNSTPTAELEWLDSGLEPGNRFRYRVVAVDQLGNRGEPSAEAEAVTR
jgi:predicted small lipoprotein YifL